MFLIKTKPETVSSNKVKNVGRTNGRSPTMCPSPALRCNYTILCFWFSQHFLHDMMEWRIEIFENESKCQSQKISTAPCSLTHMHRGKFTITFDTHTKKNAIKYLYIDFYIFLTTLGFVPRIQLKFCINACQNESQWFFSNFFLSKKDLTLSPSQFHTHNFDYLIWVRNRERGIPASCQSYWQSNESTNANINFQRSNQIELLFF